MEEIKRIYFLSRAPIFFIGLMTAFSSRFKNQFFNVKIVHF